MSRYLFIMANEGHRWGGSEPLWSQAAERLVRAGNDVRISAKDWGSPVPQIERLRSAGSKIFLRNEYGPLSYRVARRFLSLPPHRHLHLKAVSSESDLIVISQGHNWDGLDWMEGALSIGRRYTVIAQSAVVYWWPPDDVAERLAIAYRNAAAAYFVSQATLDLTEQQFAGPLQNAKVVRQPFNVRYDAQQPWPDATPDELRLAFVGRLDVISKGQDLLLQVLALPHWRSRNVRLSLIGKGPHERILRMMADRLELKNVDFAGESSDIEGVWRQHHALVLPSRFEGMPLVVIEAMLCGRPCIVSDVGGNRELVRDGVNGFLAKAPTVELLDEAMNRAWENRHRFEHMGIVASEDVRKWVPADPGDEFAQELATLANRDGKGRPGRS